jgi:cell division protein FtsL
LEGSGLSNLARNIQQQQQQQQQQQEKVTTQNTSTVKIKKHWLTPGEKIIGVLFAGMVCFGAVHIISNQSQIYEVNKGIQETGSSIEEQKKEINDLKVQVSELSQYSRIEAKAKKMGLSLNPNNIKVVPAK